MDRTTALWTISDVLRALRRQRVGWLVFYGVPLDISLRDYWDSL